MQEKTYVWSGYMWKKRQDPLVWPLWMRFVPILLVAVIGMLAVQRISIGAVVSTATVVANQDSQQFEDLSLITSVQTSIDAAYISLLQATSAKPMDTVAMSTFAQTATGIDQAIQTLTATEAHIVLPDWDAMKRDASVLISDAIRKPSNVSQDLANLQNDAQSVSNDLTMLTGVDTNHTLGIDRAEQSAIEKIHAISMEMLGVMTCVAVGIFSIVAWQTRRRIRRLTQGLHRAAVGDLSIRFESIRDRTEIGFITREVQLLVDSLSRIVKLVLAAVGDTVIQANLLLERVETARLAGSEIDRVVQSLNIAIGDSYFELERGRDELSAASSAVSCLSQAVEEVSDRAAEVTSSSHVGLQHLATIQTIMLELGQSTSVSQQVYMSTQQQFERLVSKVQMISQIAETTELLALNASIEAARSGQSSFTVIAVEVRKLAMQTSDVSQLILEAIRELGVSMHETGLSVRAAQRLTSEAVAHIEQTKGTFESIVVGMSELERSSANTAVTVRESVTCMERIIGMLRNAINTIQAISTYSAEVAVSLHAQLSDFETLNRTSETVSETARHLETSVARFTV
ncbi:methyl-accepting chemotaxis protein [Alicyclobacillus sacchari]|uniref:Methyl-accepting chemotaxis protein n=1 Tax=Alicyclobacillus sacchari TaxID=392010 RepID=A0A4R8LJJ4_9BACL|nr:methyl-accepting chemotaxis protein [Alicyclobacillus sacchari]TDY43985.1 methyl-accepting chemotaxis protein [Alicyclobacillus sacchari]GMA58224.1 hypothetical protein GCM10025858_27270 [Alicyclobacillus sacchari]